MSLKTGEKYLRIKLGSSKDSPSIVAFPKETKDGKTYYQAVINVFVEEKKEQEREAI